MKTLRIRPLKDGVMLMVDRSDNFFEKNVCPRMVM
jgi:hypothetical protein